MGVRVLSGEKIVVIVDREKGVRVKRIGRSFREFAGAVKIKRPGDVDEVVEEERAKDIGYRHLGADSLSRRGGPAPQ